MQSKTFTSESFQPIGLIWSPSDYRNNQYEESGPSELKILESWSDYFLSLFWSMVQCDQFLPTYVHANHVNMQLKEIWINRSLLLYVHFVPNFGADRHWMK